MPIPMTVEGAEALRAELQHRKTTLRQEIAKAIGEAREHGDLKENAEYHAAKERQGFLEGRIAELQYKLASADVIDPATLPKDADPQTITFDEAIALVEAKAASKKSRKKK